MEEDFENRVGMFRMLGYLQWHYIRRLGRGRKPKGRRGIGCYAAPKTISLAKHHGDMLQFPKAEANPFQVEQSPAEANSVLDNDPCSTLPTARASLTASETSEEKIDELWVLHFPAHQLCGLGTDSNNSIIMLKDKADVQSSKLKDSRGCYLSRNLSDGKSTQFLEECEKEGKNLDGAKEVMEVFEINRELFAKIVQDPCVAIRKQFDDHQTLRRKAKFAKSRSFPVDDLSGVKYLKQTTMKHKQNEVWSFPREYKQVAEPSSDPAKTPSRNSAEVSGRSVVHGWNQMILNYFKGFKRRIRRALRDNRKERESRGKASAAIDFSGDMFEDDRRGSSLMNDGQSSESKRRSYRRMSSLNESADKYAQLFKSTSTREVGLHPSRSLMLANDIKPTANESSVKTFRRRLSLPENLSFLFSEASFGTIRSSMPITNDSECSPDAEVGNKLKPESVYYDSNSEKPSEVTVSTNFLDTIQEAGEISFTDDSGGISTNENHEKLEVNLAEEIETSLCERTEMPVSEEQLNSVPCPETLPPEEEITPENETACVALDNPENIGSSLSTRVADNILRSYGLDEKDGAAFIYVCNLLVISGAFDNKLESWYSEDQPLNPKLFHEVNASTKPDIGSTEEFLGDSDHHRLQLLFDLVNGSLLEVYEQSASYFPKAFSFNQRVRSIPKGRRMLKEVWTRVNRLWGLRPELDQSLDEVMARDMAKGARCWLNYQWDGECVTLELEDLVFDELLDEVLNSFDI